MNINELTIGQVKEIIGMFAPTQQAAPTMQHPFIGKYAVCRCYSAGVHSGYVVSVDGDRVILRESRRLWSWRAKAGIALSGVAQYGLDSDVKIDTLNPEIYLTGVIEIIPCSDAAKKSIEDA